MKNIPTATSKGSNTAFLRLGAGAIALSLMALLLPACGNNSGVTTTENTPGNTDTADVAQNPDEYVGQTISVRNEVQEMVGSSAFLIDEDTVFGGEEVLVINTDAPLVLPDGEGTEVQVNGEVQRLDLANLRANYQLDLDPALFAEYENQPVIIASSVALAPDPADITAEPEKYYNQRIAVEGEVEEIVGNGAFTIDEERLFSGDGLLVLPTETGSTVNEDEKVVVTGVLRPFVQADFERDYDFTWDQGTQEKINAEYQERPVFVAEAVYPTGEQ